MLQYQHRFKSGPSLFQVAVDIRLDNQNLLQHLGLIERSSLSLEVEIAVRDMPKTNKRGALMNGHNILRAE